MLTTWRSEVGPSGPRATNNIWSRCFTFEGWDPMISTNKRESLFISLMGLTEKSDLLHRNNISKGTQRRLERHYNSTKCKNSTLACQDLWESCYYDDAQVWYVEWCVGLQNIYSQHLYLRYFILQLLKEKFRKPSTTYPSYSSIFTGEEF